MIRPAIQKKPQKNALHREDSLQEGDEFSCVFERLSFGGQVISHAPDGRVLFASGAAPGDRARVRVIEVKKRFVVAEIAEFEAFGKARRDWPCAHAAKCGGCPWGIADHALQLQALQAHLTHLFNHPCQMHAVPPVQGWRSTGRLHWDNGLLGFYEQGTQSLFEVTDCLAFSPVLMRMLRALRARFLPVLKGKGVLRLTAAAESDSGTIALECEDWPTYEAILGRANEAICEEIHGVKISVAGQETACSAQFGEGFDVLGAHHIISPAGSFVQAHQPGNELLVQTVTDAVLHAQKELKSSKLLELFAGSGNFTFPLAEAGLQVTAVEIDGAAVQSLQNEAQKRGLAVHAVASDATQMQLLEQKMLLLDPPRSGDPKLEARVREAFELQRIFYVSCHPATLARDAEMLERCGFLLTDLHLFDLFPQTGHVETFAVFARGRNPLSNQRNRSKR